MTTTTNETTMGSISEFISPSGYSFTIREQNGADDDILSNEQDSRTLMNLTKFISAIVVETDFTKTKKLTIEDALSLPANDRYAILIRSRIFSLGNSLEFEFIWPGEKNPITYEQDLSELLFDDYGSDPSEEELNSKPYAIPYYTTDKITDIEFTISSGKELKFDLLDGGSEMEYVLLPESERSRNRSLITRNLHLKMGDKWVKVTNFSMFSVKEMLEIHKFVKNSDPIFPGHVEIENPSTNQKTLISILGQPNFFYLGGI